MHIASALFLSAFCFSYRKIALATNLFKGNDTATTTTEIEKKSSIYTIKSTQTNLNK